MRVEYVKKKGRVVVEYGLSDGRQYSKEDVIPLIEAGEVENCKIQIYKGAKIVRIKGTVREIVAKEPKVEDKIQEVSVGKVLTSVIREMGLDYNGFREIVSRTAGNDFIKKTTASIKRKRRDAGEDGELRDIVIRLFGKEVVLAKGMPNELSNEQMIQIRRRLAVVVVEMLRDMQVEYSEFVIRNITNGAIEEL